MSTSINQCSNSFMFNFKQNKVSIIKIFFDSSCLEPSHLLDG